MQRMPMFHKKRTKRTTGTRICYHGTNAKNATLIRTLGFNPGTWFARHLEDAIGYGGEHVFEVLFINPPSGWQFMLVTRKPPDTIVSYKIYQTETVYDLEHLRKKIFESNLTAYC